jgi:hypothetical protein
VKLVSKSLLAFHHGLGAGLTRGELISASKPSLQARSANGADFITLICRVRGKYLGQGGRFVSGSMHLDLSTTTLLAGLSHLLSPSPVCKIPIRNDVVYTNIAINVRRSVGVDFAHGSLDAHD